MDFCSIVNGVPFQYQFLRPEAYQVSPTGSVGGEADDVISKMRPGYVGKTVSILYYDCRRNCVAACL